MPGGGARALLALAALLDGHGIPGAVLTGPAADAYLAGEGSGEPRDREPARAALLAADRAGLLSADLRPAADLPPAICRRAIRQAPRCWSG